ncbi:hypothetical protein GGR53DRAFT_278475 [Hypoxylon sp. FL1150]|nr:hypothetical protein GGR53DRAFT_278475 [Hypoxylon sp. FL1150]
MLALARVFPCFAAFYPGRPLPRLPQARPTAPSKRLYPGLFLLHPGFVSSCPSCVLANPVHYQSLWPHNKTRMSPLPAQHPFFTPTSQPDQNISAQPSPIINSRPSYGLFFVAIPKTFSIPTGSHSIPVRPCFDLAGLSSPRIALLVPHLVDRRETVHPAQLRNQSHYYSARNRLLPKCFATGFIGIVRRTCYLFSIPQGIK